MARLRDLVLFSCCALCAWLSVASVHAQPAALQALVRVAEPADQTWLPRIRGQLGDLPVQLKLAPGGPLEPKLRDQLVTARLLAQQQGGRVVIWAVRAPERMTLVVADLELDRVLVRELPSGDGERDRSAQDEAAALVVRSACKASLAGEPLGRTPLELEPEPGPAAEPVPQAAPVPAPAAIVERAQPVTAEPPSESAPLRTLLALGALAGADGATQHGHYGLSARAALVLGRLELGLRGSFGLRATVARTPVDLQLAQHRLAGYVGWSVLSTRALRLTLAGAAGVQVFRTSERAAASGFEPERGRGVLALLGAGALLSYLPHFAGGRVGLAWSAFGELYPERLSLGYRSGGFVRVARAWPVQPVFTMELVLRLGG